ncbi:MAG: ankyrin repeat domain-containing protein [Nitrospirota bacterium]
MARVGVGLGAMVLAGLLAGCATPLGTAVEQGNVKGINALLDQGTDVNERGACGWNAGETPLMCATSTGNLEIAKLLLDRGADVNAKHDYGTTALDIAVSEGNVQLVQLLLQRGAETNNAQVQVCDRGGLAVEMCTSIQYAQLKGYTKIIRLLEQAEERELAKLGVSSSPTPSPSKLEAPAASVSDVDSLPGVRMTPNPNAYAIVIGIEQYRQQLPKADFAAHDARVMGDYLTKVMGYEEENVAVLLNDRAAKTDLEKYIEHWLPKRVEPGASVFIYYSGHGAPNPKTGDAYLVPYDGDPTFVDATGYPLKRLYEQVGKLPAKDVVVMLDSCFSGAGGRSVLGKGMRPMMLTVENPVLASGKTIVLAASQGDQVSSTYDQKSHGLLTYFFLKGLRGDADKNKDGSVDLAEIFNYLKPQVERKARRDFNNEQTPQLLGSPEFLKRSLRLVDLAELQPSHAVQTSPQQDVSEEPIGEKPEPRKSVPRKSAPGFLGVPKK